MNTTLELLESGWFAFRIEGDDFPVEHELVPWRLAAARPRLEGGGDLRKLMRLLIPEPRPEAGVPSCVDFDDRPDSVVLRLVDQLGIGQRSVGQRREHWTEELMIADF